ncbi:phosphatase PAP2 family protein [Lachnospira multipara]|uniref:phosphatase PAP2 family protein n=1 Tax=Lachnospira multipara TaxID=28051 RepID=UPI0004E273A5|nr:phosphatase PAP2 family protein [Lachnospira multipara]
MDQFFNTLNGNEIPILKWFASLHNPVTDPIMYVITKLGDKGILWILLGLLMLTVLPKRYRKVGLTVALALIFSVIMCNGVMKNVCQRVRPFNFDNSLFDTQLYNVFASIDDWSFPSGHTSASFAAAFAIILWNKREGVCAMIMAALIALSRLYLNVHYPTDVLVSLILGSIYGILAYLIIKAILNKSEKLKAIFINGENYKTIFTKK